MRGLSTLNPNYYSTQHGFILKTEECTLFCPDKTTWLDEHTILSMISASCYINNISEDLHRRLLLNAELRQDVAENVEEAVLKQCVHNGDVRYELLGKGFKYSYSEDEFHDLVYVI